MEILWKRFEVIIKFHINSVSEIDTHKLQSLDVRPHYVMKF